MASKRALPLAMLLLALALLQRMSAPVSAANVHNAEVEDNEFAEFEDPDEPPAIGQEAPRKPQSPGQQKQQQQHPPSPPPSPLASEGAGPSAEEASESSAHSQHQDQDQQQPADADDEAASVQSSDDDGGFNYLEDKDEFEGFEESRAAGGSGTSGSGEKQDLKIAKIPVPLSTNWDSYYLELITLTGLAVYFLNFIVGKSKNAKLANAWFDAHRDYLKSEFHVVGDDGKGKEVTGSVGLMRDSEHAYSLWCSGRHCVDGMLVELRFIKRQDVVSLITKLFRPASDQLLVKLVLDDSSEWENFVLAVVPRRRSGQLTREHADLAQFCSDRRSQLDGKAFGLPDSLTVLAEDAEVTESLLDRRVVSVLGQFEATLDYLIVSDMYSGPRAQQDDSSGGAGGAGGGAGGSGAGGGSGQGGKPTDTQRAIVLSLRVGRRSGSTSTEDMESLLPLFKMLLYLVDRTRKARLSKEARAKADKRRVKAAETAQKMAHGQRQEAAQLRREEKRKVEKEKMLLEEDPDRARKLEDREAKREAKRKAPKMKMLKVKGM